MKDISIYRDISHTLQAASYNVYQAIRLIGEADEMTVELAYQIDILFGHMNKLQKAIDELHSRS